jgi:hypothetical protein
LGVTVDVRVAVNVGVGVRVAVLFRVGVFVRVGVAVVVGVLVRVGVALAVEVAVGDATCACALARLPAPITTTANPASPSEIQVPRVLADVFM